MSDEKRPATARRDRMVRTACVGGWYSGPTIQLGDLRALVATTDGLPDEAEVTVERTSAHHIKKDEYLIGRVNVEYEEKPGE